MNRKTPVLFFFFLLLFGTNKVSYAQKNILSIQHEVDSLKTALKSLTEDTSKVNILNSINILLQQAGNYDSALAYGDRARVLAIKIDFKIGLASVLQSIGNDYIEMGDFTKAFEYLTKSQSVSQESGNQKGIASAVSSIGNIYIYQGNNTRALEYLFKALDIYQGLNDKENCSRILGNIGSVYYKQSNHPQALEYNFKALSLANEIGYSGGAYYNIGNIGNIYHDQGNYAKALEYYFKALPIAQELGEKNGIARNLGNIGVTYSEQGNYTKALEYNFKALAIRKEIGNKVGTSINLENIGNTYYNLHDYDKALDYNNQALIIARELGGREMISSNFNDIAKIYIKQKKFIQARQFLDSALYLAESIGDKGYTVSAFLVSVMLDSATNNYKSGLDDYKKYILYRDSLINKDEVKKFTQLEVGYEFQKKEDSTRVEQEKADIVKSTEIKRKGIITNSAILISVLTILLAFLLINRQQIKRKNDKIIFEKEKQSIENELVKAKTILNEYTQSLVEKNKLLEDFKTDLEKLNTLKTKEIAEERVGNLEHLNKTTIITEDDWNKFKGLFEQVYKGFFIRLKEKLPDLTQAEIRLVCLTKLKMDTKEMAGILGVSIPTIRQTRYRLRKKIGLPGDGGIDDIIESV